jgi:hypothetical protein
MISYPMILIHGTQSTLPILCFASLHPTVKPAPIVDVVLKRYGQSAVF